MEFTANRSRHNLPHLVNANELAPAQRGSQLPATLQLPTPALLARFGTLAVHLQASGMQMLPKPPLALNINYIGERDCRIQLHISPELTAEPGVCRDLYYAITAFMARPMWSGATTRGGQVTDVSFTGDQTSTEGVGAFTVQFRLGMYDLVAPAQAQLDAALAAVIEIARFVQVVDGDVDRLAELLRDPELAPHLLSIGKSLIVNGAAGQLSTEVRIGRLIDPAAIENAASRLVRMGHLDLAMMVLATGIRHAHWIHLSRLIEAFLSLLENTPLLSDDRHFETAFELIDQLILSDPEMAKVGHQATCKRCFGLVNHLVNLKMPGAALALANRIFLERPGTLGLVNRAFLSVLEQVVSPEQPGYQSALEKILNPDWPGGGEYQSALEQIWNAASGSIEIMQDVVDTLSGLRQDWATALHTKYAAALLETKAALAVLESPHREALALLGFTFSYGFDPEGRIVIGPRGGIRSDQVNEDLITITISNAGEGGFVPGVHGEGMLDYAESLMQGSPGLDHVRSFCLPVIDFLMAHFAELPQAVQWRLHALAPAVMELADSAMRSSSAPVRRRAVPILKNVQLFVGATLLHRVPDTTMSLAPLFKGAAIMGSTEATDLLFESWKTLTGADDLACHSLLLRSAHFHLAVEMNAPISGARQMVERARQALNESLKLRNANLANALDLHHALLGFIAMLESDGSMPEWAMSALAEMACDPALQQLCRVEPNAAAWPRWLHASLSLENLSGERCLALLSKCAELPGVVADDGWDALFARGIRQLVDTCRDPDERYPLALQAFMIWQSVAPAQIGSRERLPSDLVETLVSSLHKAIVNRRPFTRVDSQRAAAALMDQWLQGDAAAALNHLDAVLASKVIQQDHPLLGVLLCVRCAEYFGRRQDAVRMRQLVAKALAHLPTDPQRAAEAIELLRPLLDLCWNAALSTNPS